MDFKLAEQMLRTVDSGELSPEATSWLRENWRELLKQAETSQANRALYRVLLTSPRATGEAP